MHTLLISRKALSDQGWVSWLAVPIKCSTPVSFCTFRPCMDYSSSLSFYLFHSKQPETVAVISRLWSTGEDQIHIWVVLVFSAYGCQEFSLPTWYSTRYHPNGGESVQQNLFQSSHRITHLKTAFLHQLPRKSLNMFASGSCKWHVNTRRSQELPRIPITTKASYMVNKSYCIFASRSWTSLYLQ